MENPMSLRNEYGTEHTDSSWDGPDSKETIPAYTAVSENQNAADYPVDDTMDYMLENVSVDTCRQLFPQGVPYAPIGYKQCVISSGFSMRWKVILSLITISL